MSVGPLGNINALSGTSQELANQARRSATDVRAEMAAGLGEMDADRETSDRDADGRRPWEFPQRAADEQSPKDPANPIADEPLQSKDASGQCGGALDLLG